MPVNELWSNISPLYIYTLLAFSWSSSLQFYSVGFASGFSSSIYISLVWQDPVCLDLVLLKQSVGIIHKTIKAHTSATGLPKVLSCPAPFHSCHVTPRELSERSEPWQWWTLSLWLYNDNRYFNFIFISCHVTPHELSELSEPREWWWTLSLYIYNDNRYFNFIFIF